MGKQILTIADEPRYSKEIKHKIIAILSQLNDLSPSYLMSTNRSLGWIQSWADYHLEQIELVEHQSENYQDVKADLWYIIVPDIRAFGKTISLTHFDFAGKDLEINLPEYVKIEEKMTEKVYSRGCLYDFYKDVLEIVKKAKNEVIITDNYANEELINLYLEKIPENVKIKVLTKKPQGNFVTVAKKFKAKPNVRFEARISNDWHDRWVFIDNECWVTGQSVRDAGAKPTYLVKLDGYAILKNCFDEAWNKAVAIV